MHRNFSWFALCGVMLLVLDGCQVGAVSAPSQARKTFLRNIASSLDNRDSTLWVTRPDVYGTVSTSEGMRGPRNVQRPRY